MTILKLTKRVVSVYADVAQNSTKSSQELKKVRKKVCIKIWKRQPCLRAPKVRLAVTYSRATCKLDVPAHPATFPHQCHSET